MREKRYISGSPELTLDISSINQEDNIDNNIEDEENNLDKDNNNNNNNENLIYKKDNMQKIIGIVLIVLFLFLYFLLPIGGKNREVGIEKNTQDEINLIKQRAEEFKEQKKLREQKKQIEEKLRISIFNVSNIEKEMSKIRKDNLQLIK